MINGDGLQELQYPAEIRHQLPSAKHLLDQVPPFSFLSPSNAAVVRRWQSHRSRCSCVKQGNVFFMPCQVLQHMMGTSRGAPLTLEDVKACRPISSKLARP